MIEYGTSCGFARFCDRPRGHEGEHGAWVETTTERLREKPAGQVGNPRVQGRCPSCAGSSLFLGDSGYVTCARLDCADPLAADSLLHQGAFARPAGDA